MEDSELEEGEACSYNNNNFHNDAGIDPDVAYSYIVRICCCFLHLEIVNFNFTASFCSCWLDCVIDPMLDSLLIPL